MKSRQQQKTLARDQFRNTAQVFGDYALASRVLDILVADDPAMATLNNHIERVRDRSHTRPLGRGEFDVLFANHALRILDACVKQQLQSFDQWILVAGSVPGDLRYEEALHLVEEPIPDDAAGFHPWQVSRTEQGQRELVIEKAMLFIVAEKVGP
jgi:hypothetical protein